MEWVLHTYHLESILKDAQPFLEKKFWNRCTFAKVSSNFRSNKFMFTILFVDINVFVVYFLKV